MFFLNKKLIYALMIIAAFLILFAINRYSSNILKLMYPVKYSDYIYKYSSQYKIDPYIVFALIKAESNFNPDAVSKRDAKGLMQITPETGKWIASEIGIKNYSDSLLFNPDINIKMGSWYISDLSKEFKDMKLILAAYNGGRGNVARWLKDRRYSHDGKTLDNIPFKETDRYTKKVLEYYKIYRELYGR